MGDDTNIATNGEGSEEKITIKENAKINRKTKKEEIAKQKEESLTARAKCVAIGGSFSQPAEAA